MKNLFFILTFLFFCESISADNKDWIGNKLSNESSLIFVNEKDNSFINTSNEGNKISSNVNPKTPKFKGYIEQTMIFTKGYYKKYTRYGLDAIFGIQFSNAIYLGIGSGWVRWDSYYKNDNRTATSIPVFLNLRYYKNNPITPYISLKLGVLLGTPKGGFINPTAGLRFKISDKAGVNVGAGYNLTLVHEDFGSRYISSSANPLLHGLNLTAGIDF